MKGDNPGSNIATIITASGTRYSYLELRDVIQVQKTQVTSPLDSIELPVSESVPLELCLTKRSREMLASGTTAPDKQRNNSGIELARDLIGTTAYLERIGQAYNGSPEILFFDWCRAVALDTDKPKGQPEGIWKSASKDNPSLEVGRMECKPVSRVGTGVKTSNQRGEASAVALAVAAEIAGVMAAALATAAVTMEMVVMAPSRKLFASPSLRHYPLNRSPKKLMSLSFRVQPALT
jgi:hypothetical protein